MKTRLFGNTRLTAMAILALVLIVSLAAPGLTGSALAQAAPHNTDGPFRIGFDGNTTSVTASNTWFIKPGTIAAGSPKAMTVNALFQVLIYEDEDALLAGDVANVMLPEEDECNLSLTNEVQDCTLQIGGTDSHMLLVPQIIGGISWEANAHNADGPFQIEFDGNTTSVTASNTWFINPGMIAAGSPKAMTVDALFQVLIYVDEEALLTGDVANIMLPEEDECNLSLTNEVQDCTLQIGGTDSDMLLVPQVINSINWATAAPAAVATAIPVTPGTTMTPATVVALPNVPNNVLTMGHHAGITGSRTDPSVTVNVYTGYPAIGIGTEIWSAEMTYTDAEALQGFFHAKVEALTPTTVVATVAAPAESACAYEYAPGTMLELVDGLNHAVLLHAEPNAASTVVGQLYAGRPYYVVVAQQVNCTWLEIAVDGMRGWMIGDVFYDVDAMTIGAAPDAVTSISWAEERIAEIAESCGVGEEWCNGQMLALLHSSNLPWVGAKFLTELPDLEVVSGGSDILILATTNGKTRYIFAGLYIYQGRSTYTVSLGANPASYFSSMGGDYAFLRDERGPASFTFTGPTDMVSLVIEDNIR